MRVFSLAIIFCIISNYIIYGQSDSLLLKNHVYVLADDSMNGRGFGSVDGQKAARYIADAFSKNGLKPLNGNYYWNFSYKMGSARVYGQNIVGLIEGSDSVLKKEYIVLGAHYDHMGYDNGTEGKIIYNGADDNASGTSTLIELSRILAQNRDQLKRSVLLVAFDGEESGLIGSDYLVNDSLFPINQVKAMFSIDMVGMLSTYKGINLKGSSTLVGGDDFFTALSAKYQIDIKKLGSTIEDRTDTKPFGDKGIPAIAITTGLKSPYHKPEDDAPLLDYAGMATITDFLYDATCRLSAKTDLNSAIPLASAELNKRPKIFTAAAILNLGSGKYYFNNTYYTSKPVFATEIGLRGSIRLSRNLSFQPAIYGQLAGGHDENGRDYTTSLIIPMNLNLAIARSADGINRFCIFGGIYQTILLGGDSKFVKDSDSSYGKEFSDVVGLNAGFTFEIYPIIMGLTLEYCNSYMENSAIEKQFRPRNAFFTFGYRIR